MSYKARVIIPTPNPAEGIELVSRTIGAFQTVREARIAAEEAARAMPEAAGFSFDTISTERAATFDGACRA